jgi:hypothetical protein
MADIIGYHLRDPASFSVWRLSVLRYVPTFGLPYSTLPQVPQAIAELQAPSSLRVCSDMLTRSSVSGFFGILVHHVVGLVQGLLVHHAVLCQGEGFGGDLWYWA